MNSSGRGAAQWLLSVLLPLVVAVPAAGGLPSLVQMTSFRLVEQDVWVFSWETESTCRTWHPQEELRRLLEATATDRESVQPSADQRAVGTAAAHDASAKASGAAELPGDSATSPYLDHDGETLATDECYEDRYGQSGHDGDPAYRFDAYRTAADGERPMAPQSIEQNMSADGVASRTGDELLLADTPLASAPPTGDDLAELPFNYGRDTFFGERRETFPPLAADASDEPTVPIVATPRHLDGPTDRLVRGLAQGLAQLGASPARLGAALRGGPLATWSARLNAATFERCRGAAAGRLARSRMAAEQAYCQARQIDVPSVGRLLSLLQPPREESIVASPGDQRLLLEVAATLDRAGTALQRLSRRLTALADRGQPNRAATARRPVPARQSRAPGGRQAR